MAEQSKPPKRDLRVYRGDRFNLAEQVNSQWRMRMEMGATKADVLRQEYWSHVAPELHTYDEIIATCDDGTVYARILILDCGRTWAKVQILEWHNLTTADVAQSQTNAGEFTDYKIEHKGIHKKFVITRLSDGEVINEGEHARKEAAEGWLRDFINRRTAATTA